MKNVLFRLAVCVACVSNANTAARGADTGEDWRRDAPQVVRRLGGIGITLIVLDESASARRPGDWRLKAGEAFAVSAKDKTPDASDTPAIGIQRYWQDQTRLLPTIETFQAAESPLRLAVALAKPLLIRTTAGIHTDPYMDRPGSFQEEGKHGTIKITDIHSTPSGTDVKILRKGRNVDDLGIIVHVSYDKVDDGKLEGHQMLMQDLVELEGFARDTNIGRVKTVIDVRAAVPVLQSAKAKEEIAKVLLDYGIERRQ